MDKVHGGQLRLRADGPAFEDDAFELRSLERLLTNYRQLVDYTLPIAVGQRRMTPHLRSKLRYEVRLEHNCLTVLLDLIQYESEAVLASVVATKDGGLTLAESVTRLLKAGFELRKALAAILASGKEPKLVINPKIETHIHADNNSGEISVQTPMYVVSAEAGRPAMDRILRQVDSENVEHVLFSSESGDESLSLTPDDASVAGADKFILDQPAQLLGRLRMVDFSSRRAAIETEDGRYAAHWEESLERKIERFTNKPGVLFKVKMVFDRRRLREEPIEYIILDAASTSVLRDD